MKEVDINMNTDNAIRCIIFFYKKNSPKIN